MKIKVQLFFSLKLCDKDQSLFDERLKRHMKTRQQSGPKIIKEDKPQKILPTPQKISQ